MKLATQDQGLREVFPLTEEWHSQLAVLVGGLLLLVLGSELLVSWFVRKYVKSTGDGPDEENATTSHKGVGRVIGKCENLLVFVFVQLSSFDGLGLVLAAKSIARMEAIRRNASYYLGGTLLNFVWSLIVSLAVRLVAFGPP